MAVSGEGQRRLVRLLLPGSFNPITIAHLRMIELARDFLTRSLNLELEKAVLSPVGDSYGEKKNLQPANLRVEMCRLATQDMDWIDVDDWESQQPTWVRSLEVLQRQKELALQQEPPVQRVMLLCGADVITSFSKPGLWSKEHIESILRDFGVLVVTRKGAESFTQHVPPECEQVIGGLHRVEEWIPNEISSTKIRFGIKNGFSVRHLTPTPVLQFIQDRKLYETEPE